MCKDIELIIGLIIMAILSAIIRFTTLCQFFIDSVLGFIMGYSVYEALDYFSMSGETRSGIAGIVIMVSRPLYDAVNVFIKEKLGKIISRKLDK